MKKFLFILVCLFSVAFNASAQFKVAAKQESTELYRSTTAGMSMVVKEVNDTTYCVILNTSGKEIGSFGVYDTPVTMLSFMVPNTFDFRQLFIESSDCWEVPATHYAAGVYAEGTLKCTKCIKPIGFGSLRQLYLTFYYGSGSVVDNIGCINVKYKDFMKHLDDNGHLTK